MPATSTKELNDRKGFRRRRTEMGGGDKGWKYAYEILMFGPKNRTKSLILYVHYFSESTNVCVHTIVQQSETQANDSVSATGWLLQM